MLRLLIILAVLIGSTGSTVKEPNRVTLRRSAARTAELAANASDLVRTRFALAAAASACGYAGSLYGYNLLLAQFDLYQQTVIEAAAREGSRSLQSGKTSASCADTLKRLSASDDDLILLAEHIGQERR